MATSKVQRFYIMHQSSVFSSKEYDIFYINAASFKTSYAEHFDTLRQAIHLLSDMLYQSSDKKVNVCDGYVN